MTAAPPRIAALPRERVLEFADSRTDPGERERLLDLAGKWRHGYIPLDAIAMAIKAKHRKGDGVRRRGIGDQSHLEPYRHAGHTVPAGKSRLDPKGAAAHASLTTGVRGKARPPARAGRVDPAKQAEEMKRAAAEAVRAKAPELKKRADAGDKVAHAELARREAKRAGRRAEPPSSTKPAVNYGEQGPRRVSPQIIAEDRNKSQDLRDQHYANTEKLAASYTHTELVAELKRAKPGSDEEKILRREGIRRLQQAEHPAAPPRVSTEAIKTARKPSKMYQDFRAEREQQDRRFEAHAKGGVGIGDVNSQEYKDYFGVGDHSTTPQEERLTFAKYREQRASGKAEERAHAAAYKAGFALGKEHARKPSSAAAHDAQYNAHAAGHHEEHFAGGYGDGIIAASKPRAPRVAKQPVARRRPTAAAQAEHAGQAPPAAAPSSGTGPKHGLTDYGTKYGQPTTTSAEYTTAHAAELRSKLAESHPVGALVDARQPGIDQSTRGVVAAHQGGMLEVAYKDRHGATTRGTFNPSHTTVVKRPAETPEQTAARIGMTFPKPTVKGHAVVGEGTVERSAPVSSLDAKRAERAAPTTTHVGQSMSDGELARADVSKLTDRDLLIARASEGVNPARAKAAQEEINRRVAAKHAAAPPAAGTVRLEGNQSIAITGPNAGKVRDASEPKATLRTVGANGIDVTVEHQGTTYRRSGGGAFYTVPDRGAGKMVESPALQAKLEKAHFGAVNEHYASQSQASSPRAFGAAANSGQRANVGDAQAQAREAARKTGPSVQGEMFGAHGQQQPDMFDQPSSAKIRVEHTGDGTVVTGTDRADTETTSALKAQGFKWSRNLGGWYLPRTWNEPTRDARVRGLEARLGNKISVERGSKARTGTGAEQQAATVARAGEIATEQRARAEKFRAESEARDAAARRISNGIPLGQPILVGHHSEARHRSDIAKIRGNTEKSWQAQQAADHAEGRARSAEARARLEADPKFAARRLARNEAELRKVQRNIAAADPNDAHTATLHGIRQDLEAKIAADRPTAAAGAGHSRATITPGDVVTHRGTSYVVHKTNAKTVSVPHWEPRLAAAGYTNTIPYSQIDAHGKLENAKPESLRTLLARPGLPAPIKSRIEAILRDRGESL